MLHTKYENGSVIELQADDSVEPKDDRTIKVNLPPVGYVYQRNENWDNYGELVYYGAWKRDEKDEDQFWDRKAFFSQWDFNYFERRRKEYKHQQEDPDYVDIELEDFRLQMWEYRVNGMWFYNDGYPVYLTGPYAFYLIWWKLDNGYPKFRVPDWEFFCFWQYCVDHPECMGMVEATRRRQGKTMRSGVVCYDYTTSHREAYAGIQSKSGSDAKDNVYAKGVLNKIKHLPDFFIPKYDLEKGKYPKSGLFFRETNIRGKASIDLLINEDLDELNSSLTWKASDHIAYDGEKLHRYVGDEVGKTEAPIDVYKRHLVVYFCLMDDEYRVIGKALYTTTVEEMTSGGAQFKLIWDASNQANRDENGKTSSGLFRYFQPAQRTLNIDKYGVPDEEKSLQQIANTRKHLEEKGDYIALASYIRKNPTTVKEMFYINPDDCAFDIIRINHQIEKYSWMNVQDLYQIGNLLWVDGPGSSVKFVKNPQGRWWFRNDLDLTDENEWNQVEKKGSIYLPKAHRMAGVDPYSHNKTKDKRNSNGACYVGNKPSVSTSESMKPIVEYIERPKTVNIFYDDMIKTWHFCGCEATVEDNKIGLINYAEDNGYKGFVKEFDGKPGISATKGTHAHIMDELEDFVSGSDNDLHKCTFTRLLTDISTFDIDDTEKNDASMAFAYYRIGCFSHRYKKKPLNTVDLPDTLHDVNELFR